MSYFESYFLKHQDINIEDRANALGEVAVCCPFPHYSESEQDFYIETNPSAHINLDRRVLHCKVCDASYSEAAFIMKMTGMKYRDALKYLEKVQDAQNETWFELRKDFLNSESAQKTAQRLGIMEAHEELQLGAVGEHIAFPVFVNGILLGKQTYRPGHKVKTLNDKEMDNAIIPYDSWITDSRDTILCAGPKDMAIGRVLGLNTITFTHGENSFPQLYKYSFKGKRVYIVYDHDQAGLDGAYKVASYLMEAGAIPHVVTGHHAVCKEKGEDLHDFFMKYGQTVETLQTIFEHTPEFSDEDYQREREKRIPTITLEEATKGQYSNRLVSSNIQVVAKFEKVYQADEYVEIEKVGIPGKGCTMEPEERVTFVLDESRIKDVLLLMDSGLTEQKIRENEKVLAGIPPKEKFTRTIVKSRVNVFKAVVADEVEKEITTEAYVPLELTVYIVGQSIKAGQKYRITYRPVPHPLQANEVVGIVTELEEMGNSVNGFKVTESVKDSLKVFQVQEGQTVKQKMDEIFEHMKGFTGGETRKEIGLTVDLFYHTPLQFKFAGRLERAYLEPAIIGESRTGKSQTAKKALEMYELGVFASLKTATIAGMLGGSDKVQNGGFKTKIGLIPRNHKGAVILEEFSGAPTDFISKMTEMRSSNMVRLTRVNGSISIPAMVRMLTISNQRTSSSGQTMALRNYPNGVKVLLDLIGAAEDIARYDFFILVDKPDGYISPFDMMHSDPYPKESYMNRVRWVWSRSADDIIFENDSDKYIWELSVRLNKLFDCHINFFGPEAWKKLARIAIATAGCVASMDETGEKLVVKRSHVEWAGEFMYNCFANDIFKLKEYVEEHRRYSECTDQDIANLQKVSSTHGSLLSQLEMSTEMTQRQLQATSGLSQDDFNKFVKSMMEYRFTQYQGEKIVPTEKFRKGLRHIKSEYIERV